MPSSRGSSLSPKRQRMGEEMTISGKCQFSLKSLERGVSVLTCLEKKLKALSVGRDPWEAQWLGFVVQWLSHVWFFVAHQAFLSFTISQRLLKLISIESVMPSNHLIVCRPLFLLPSIFPSIRVFSRLGFRNLERLRDLEVPGALKGSLQGEGVTQVTPSTVVSQKILAGDLTDLQRASGSSIRNPGKLDGVRLSGNKKEFSWEQSASLLLAKTTECRQPSFHHLCLQPLLPPWNCRGHTLIETATLARHHSNHLHELFYDRRSW